MKIVVTDHGFPDLAVEEKIAAAAGASLVSAQTKDPARLATAVADADAVITQFAPVNADVVNALAAAGLRKNTTVSAGLRTRITIRPGYARRPGTHPEKNC